MMYTGSVSEVLALPLDVKDEIEPEFVPCPSKSMEASVEAVERIIKYKFKNKKLLEEALTHSSYTDSVSYQRLEFIGDAALGCALSNYVFLAYPSLDPGQLSLIRAANISTEKLARVAVRFGLYQYVRHNASALDDKVLNLVILFEDNKVLNLVILCKELLSL